MSELIKGTSLVVKGPNEKGKYKILKLTGPDHQVEKVNVGIRMVCDGNFPEISLHHVNLFKDKGDIESLVIEKDPDNKLTQNVF